MREKIENNFEKPEELSTEFSGKELAYLLVNLRDSIKVIGAVEQEREKYLKDIVKQPIHGKEQMETTKNIEKKLSSKIPELIDENVAIILLPNELEQLLFEINQRISIIETDKKINPVIKYIKEPSEKIEEKIDELNEELEILKTLKIKLEKLIGKEKESENI